MVNLIQVKRRKLRRYLFLLILIAIAGLVVFFLFREKEVNGGISVAEASKLIAYANAEESQITNKNTEGYWYEAYMNYVNDYGFISNRKAGSCMKYQDVQVLLKKLDLSADNLDSKLPDLKNNQNLIKKIRDVFQKQGYISKTDFLDVFMGVINVMPHGDQIRWVEAAISGTPSNINDACEWDVYTTKGSFKFNGLVLDDKIDKKIRFIAFDQELLVIDSVITDQIVYQNVWIKNSTDNKIDFNIYGMDRSFTVKGISEQVSNVLADVSLKNGQIDKVNIKTDTIQGRVLSVSKEYVEIEGYGKVDLDEYFMIYDINNGFAVKTYEDIVVGYSLQDFIVADGKVCGAIISKPLKVDNIRVIIKTNGFSSIFHQNVSFTCDTPFSITHGETVDQYNAGDVLSYDTANELLQEERITVEPNEGGTITLLSVQRNQGNPSYQGKMELSLYDGGIVIVNDVDIENYLKKVVPSEMPASFGVEALKVQAVCARSYAYNQLTNSYYSMYGAHADDSTQFQVYNNTIEHEESNQAINDTKAQVLTYGGDVVQTYYYSTSCGVTTDVGLWGTDTSEYPYFASRDVSRVDRNLDLTDEATFEQFITTKDENDYDSGCALYRWQYDLACDEMNHNFNSKLHEKYVANPSKILTLNSDGIFVSKSISSVGYINEITVNSRASGGAVDSVTVRGSDATVQINSESAIRGLFGDSNVEMTTNTGTTKMSSMPSTFCIFRGIYDGDRLLGFRITGGGYGHGIGMSQNAVNTMTQESMDYVQILQYFYKGTQVSTMTAG